MNKRDHATHAAGNAAHAARLDKRAEASTDATYKRQATTTAAFLRKVAAAHKEQAS